MRARAHGDIGALARRMQEGGGGADPPALVDGALGVGDAFLDGAVVVGVARDAEADGALDEGLAQRVAPLQVGDGQIAVAAAEGRVAVAQAPLHAPEVGQHVGVAPAAVAELRPGVEVHALAAVVDVAVDRAGAAERLAARGEDAPAAGPFAGLHAVEPVHAGVVEGLDEAGGYVDERMPVARPGLEHEHGGRAVLAQAVGQHAARRARADDHVVEGFHPRSPRSSLGWIPHSAPRQGKWERPACGAGLSIAAVIRDVAVRHPCAASARKGTSGTRTGAHKIR